MTEQEMKMLAEVLMPVREAGYVQFDSPRMDVWEKLLSDLGFTQEQIKSFYQD